MFLLSSFDFILLLFLLSDSLISLKDRRLGIWRLLSLTCIIISMGIVGVKSTAGREVKFVDPSMTTRGESAWLGYTLCDFRSFDLECLFIVLCFFFLSLSFSSSSSSSSSKGTLIWYLSGKVWMSLHNEERRLGVPRGSDTLVVPFRYIKRWDLICFFFLTCQAAVVAIVGLRVHNCSCDFSVLLISSSESKRKFLCCVFARVLALWANLWDVSTTVSNLGVSLIAVLVALSLSPSTLDWAQAKRISAMHALGTSLLQKCLRHSPPGVVYTQVRNLKELTEGHHKIAWSMWLNLTQRGESYRVRTHWGLTGARSPWAL